MSETTAIEWTDATWSPWEGCTKVSPACDHCYAEGMNKWLRKGENWGPGAPRRIYSEDHWDKPFKWQRDALKFDTLHHRRRRVFPSVCDPFDNEAPGLQRERLFATIRATPALDWLLLTKRIGNAKSMLPADWGDGYPNVWLGSTVVTQEEAGRDIPKLLAVPARVRFVSIEPMLGPIDLSDLPGPGRWRVDALRGDWERNDPGNGFEEPDTVWHENGPALHWVICGGESGHGARAMHPDWARSLRDQCATAGVPFLFKQWGEWLPRGQQPTGNPTKWTKNYFDDRGIDALLYGKAGAGRLLDGCKHDGFPMGAANDCGLGAA